MSRRAAQRQLIPKLVISYSRQLLASGHVVDVGNTYYNYRLAASNESFYSKPLLTATLPVRDFHFRATTWSIAIDVADTLTFRLLANKWKSETGHFSVLQQKIIHPAYQQIIGMGERALPLLIDEIQRSPAHWFWALRSIARENPAEGKATIDEAVTAWTDWWRERNGTRYAAMDFAR